MHKHIFTIFIVLFLVFRYTSIAQNDTRSPYSIFALGVENTVATGGLTGLGNTGVAQTSPFQINIFNPASLGYLRKKSFLYEFGVNGTYSTLKSDNESGKTNSANLSHIAIAFPIKENWGIGFGLTPFTKVGYDISFDKEIIGSAESFRTFTSGLGGLNKFYIASGAKLGNVLSVGVDISFLFGSVDELSQLFSEGLVTIRDENNYSAINLGGGFQYTFPNNKTTIGGTFSFPTLAKGSQVRNSFVSFEDGALVTIQTNEEMELDALEFPISFGIGVTSEVYKDFVASLDFRKRLWEETSQSLENEQYRNQNIYGFGLEYKPSVNNLKYWNKLKYRFGFNYNSGFLFISNRQIDSYFFSLGLGIPLNKTRRNNLNISYSIGREGTIDNNLIQENFHKISLNLNFVGNWFKERKIF